MQLPYTQPEQLVTVSFIDKGTSVVGSALTHYQLFAALDDGQDAEDDKRPKNGCIVWSAQIP